MRITFCAIPHRRCYRFIHRRICVHVLNQLNPIKAADCNHFSRRMESELEALFHVFQLMPIDGCCLCHLTTTHTFNFPQYTLLISAVGLWGIDRVSSGASFDRYIPLHDQL